MVQKGAATFVCRALDLSATHTRTARVLTYTKRLCIMVTMERHGKPDGPKRGRSGNTKSLCTTVWGKRPHHFAYYEPQGGALDIVSYIVLCLPAPINTAQLCKFVHAFRGGPPTDVCFKHTHIFTLVLDPSSTLSRSSSQSSCTRVLLAKSSPNVVTIYIYICK